MRLLSIRPNNLILYDRQDNYPLDRLARLSDGTHLIGHLWTDTSAEHTRAVAGRGRGDRADVPLSHCSTHRR